MSSIDLTFVDNSVKRIGRETRFVLPLLQAIQGHYGYLPIETLERLSAISDCTPANIWSVATFYDQFRLRPVGRHRIRVCIGTACHVKGSERVYEAFRRVLKIDPDNDTDSQGLFTVEKIACLGCCTLAPVVQIDHRVYGPVQPESVSEILEAAQQETERDLSSLPTGSSAPETERMAELRVGLGSCCMAGGSLSVRNELGRTLTKLGQSSSVTVKPVGCVGMCHQTPLVEILLPKTTPAQSEDDREKFLYTKVTTADAGRIVRRHFRAKGLWRHLRGTLDEALDSVIESQERMPVPRAVRDTEICAFLGGQRRVATEYCGGINPLDVDEYSRYEGWEGWKRAAEMTSENIIETVKKSGLRGRGGAGFSVGRKWEIVRQAKNDAAGIRYILCNGDEGDPGAFMDRMILESFPYRVLEGMAIAARAVGAQEGFLYIRAEYPLAVERVHAAIETCRQRGLLGELKLSVVEGAGAFVCGEETALIASIEGRRGMPSLRPPYPAEEGLWGKPTLINNVETYSCVPWILRNGASAFAEIGTPTSKGTKVFALAGKIRRGGLIEVPMGMTIRQVVEDIGGGVAGNKKFKAVQIGGPSGGCIPARLADTRIDFESLGEVGSMMGSGGLVVLDENVCMVDIARYFLEFTQAQSCGKCTFCRVGTKRMLEMLTALCSGKGQPGDIEKLVELARHIQQTSLCGLGKTAPNPVLSTIKYFRDEYEAHLQGRCPACTCRALIRFSITDKCIGCTLCAQRCPADAIAMKPYERHEIDNEKCVRCGTCKNVCPADAVNVE